MKTLIKQSLVLTGILMGMFAAAYPLLIWAIGLASPGNGDGRKIELDGKILGYENIGQKFVSEKYFWGRPSAVDYNAAGSGGSNKGTTNPEYLKIVQDRIDTFKVYHPSVGISNIPSDIVTASASGLDPDISVKAAMAQCARISKVRNISEEKVRNLIKVNTQQPFLNIFGVPCVHVLQLNIALDQVTK